MRPPSIAGATCSRTSPVLKAPVAAPRRLPAGGESAASRPLPAHHRGDRKGEPRPSGTSTGGCRRSLLAFHEAKADKRRPDLIQKRDDGRRLGLAVAVGA